jgi:hypothetical protein
MASDGVFPLLIALTVLVAGGVVVARVARRFLAEEAAADPDSLLSPEERLYKAAGIVRDDESGECRDLQGRVLSQRRVAALLAAEEERAERKARLEAEELARQQQAAVAAAAIALEAEREAARIALAASVRADRMKQELALLARLPSDSLGPVTELAIAGIDANPTSTAAQTISVSPSDLIPFRGFTDTAAVASLASTPAYCNRAAACVAELVGDGILDSLSVAEVAFALGVPQGDVPGLLSVLFHRDLLPPGFKFDKQCAAIVRTAGET